MSIRDRTQDTFRNYVNIGDLRIQAALHSFLVDEVLPGSGTDEASLWLGLASLIDQFAPRNIALLKVRTEMQAQIDRWHQDHDLDAEGYGEFLRNIGYLRRPPSAVEITTSNVDPEIATIAGPQLVVPIMNARYALNAANARWGSLYDALYGTDALGVPPPAGPYDVQRGAEVIAWVRAFLDEVVPLASGSHADVNRYAVISGRLAAHLPEGPVGLDQPPDFAGYIGEAEMPDSVLFRHHGLHIELVLDADHPVGKSDRAGIADVVIESAVTSIMDCEDSVAAVDAADKVAVYRNWLGLMKGNLSSEVTKNGRTFCRRLAEDREITRPDGSRSSLPGRTVMLIRNVGLLMTTNAVLDRCGNEIPEGLLDALVTVLAAKHDLKRGGGAINSRTGSIYVVKPKMHGPDEVAFANDTLAFVEEMLKLPPLTVKIGLMDEERRTSLNLMECIGAAQGRIAFINTGFLDRTGDEIHTSMRAGPMVRKGDMKTQRWLLAYEYNNVDVGLACGLRGRAQIGKGMWAAPDMMADMLKQKIAHPWAGANSAWVPSPTAATLHATHYHRVCVEDRQTQLLGRVRATIDDLLSVPVSAHQDWTNHEILEELENNAQGILGYVVRWVDQGIGCSKVPDIHDVALMEDRATCRISSQHIANWLLHGVVDGDQVMRALRRMAVVVDQQNEGDVAYVPMGPTFDGVAFMAARDLIFEGVEQPSGYTELILHSRRLAHKRRSEEIN